MKEKDDKVKRFDKAVFHYVVTIFVSMITAISTTLALASVLGK